MLLPIFHNILIDDDDDDEVDVRVYWSHFYLLLISAGGISLQPNVHFTYRKCHNQGKTCQLKRGVWSHVLMHTEKLMECSQMREASSERYSSSTEPNILPWSQLLQSPEYPISHNATQRQCTLKNKKAIERSRVWLSNGRVQSDSCDLHMYSDRTGSLCLSSTWTHPAPKLTPSPLKAARAMFSGPLSPNNPVWWTGWNRHRHASDEKLPPD